MTRIYEFSRPLTTEEKLELAVKYGMIVEDIDISEVWNLAFKLISDGDNLNYKQTWKDLGRVIKSIPDYDLQLQLLTEVLLAQLYHFSFPGVIKAIISNVEQITGEELHFFGDDGNLYPKDAKVTSPVRFQP